MVQQQDAYTTLSDQQSADRTSAATGRYVVASPTRALVMCWYEQTLLQGDIIRARQLIEFMDPADRETAEKRLATLFARAKPRGGSTPAALPALKLAPGYATATASTVAAPPIRMVSYLARQLMMLVGVISLAFVLLLLAVVAIADSSLGPKPPSAPPTLILQATQEPVVAPQEDTIAVAPTSVAPALTPAVATGTAMPLPTAVPPTPNPPGLTPTVGPPESKQAGPPVIQLPSLTVAYPEQDTVLAAFPLEIAAYGTESITLRLTLKSVLPFPAAVLVTYGAARLPITQTFNLGLPRVKQGSAYFYTWVLSPDDLRELPNGDYTLVFEQISGSAAATLRQRSFTITRESAVTAQIRVAPSLGSVTLHLLPNSEAQANGVITAGARVRILNQLTYSDEQQALTGFSYKNNGMIGGLFSTSHGKTDDRRYAFGGDAKALWCLVETQDGRRGWVPCNVLTVDQIGVPPQIIPQTLGEF